MSQYTTSIQQLYVAFFQRPADVAGLAYWEDALQKNQGDLSPVISAFVNSAETRATYAGQSNKEAVNTIYRNLFGHTADSDGLTYWTRKLDNAEVTLGDIIKAISAAASDYDSQIFNGKVNVALGFTGALDTPAKASAYASVQGGNLAKAYLGGITSITSAAIALARADSLVNDVVNVLTGTRKNGHSFDLTSNADVLIGGSDGDHFSALGSVLSAQDNLDGGAGQDSLSIIADVPGTYSPPASSHIRNIETINVMAVAGVVVDSTAWQGVQKLRVAASGDASVRALASTDMALDNTHSASSITLDGGHDVSVTQNVSHASVMTIGAQTTPNGVVDLQLTEDLDAGMEAKAETSAAKVVVHGGALVNIKQVDSDGLDNVQAADITVFGTALSKAVYIDQAATLGHLADAAIVINDWQANSNLPGSLQTVDVTSNTTLTINDNALSNLRLANSAGKVIINNAGLSNSTNTHLHLALDNAQIALSDAGIYQSLDLNVNGDENRFTSLHAASLNTLQLSGYGNFELNASDIPALRRITLASAANLSAQDLNQSSQLTLVDASSGRGNHRLTLDAQRTLFKGGSGADILTLRGKSIDLPVDLGAGDDEVWIDTATPMPKALLDGGGGNNTLSLHVQDAAYLAKNRDFATMTHNFQALMLDQLQPFQALDVGKLGDFSVVKIGGSEDPVITSLSNLGANTALQFTAHSTATVIVNSPAFASGANDVFHVKFGSPLPYTFEAGTLSLQHVETVRLEKVRDFERQDDGYYALTLQDDALTTLTSDVRCYVNLQNNTTGKVQLNLDTAKGSVTWVSGAASEIDVALGSGSAIFDFTRVPTSAKITIAGSSDLDLTLERPVSLILHGTAESVIQQFHANSSINALTTISIENLPLTLRFGQEGIASFNPQQVKLNSNASVQSYADAVVANAGNASHDAAGGWFQFAGDTFYVQSHHDASQNPHFVDGADFIIKLTGLYDLSSAEMSTLSANSLIISH